jgi:glycosyltransferase involved in cell wall biosynthesis
MNHPPNAKSILPVDCQGANLCVPVLMKLAVVIPCYNVRDHILGVLAGIGPEVEAIYVVDDACPQRSGDFVEAESRDPRVRVFRHESNQGVGGAMAHGYRVALQDGATIVVKMDGDGQMDASLMPRLIEPLLRAQADYSKGNRMAGLFRARAASRPMPLTRLLGNGLLSFAHKAASGYWNIADPANGYTAIHRAALENLPLENLERGYFFENDMLFQLNLIEAVVRDVPMPAIYGVEKSNLRIGKVLWQFPPRLVLRCARRVATKYFVHDFNVGSLEMLCGTFLLTCGALWSLYHWIWGVAQSHINTPGTVMLGALPIIMGFQLLLSALSYDVQNVPRTPLCSTWTPLEARDGSPVTHAQDTTPLSP